MWGGGVDRRGRREGKLCTVGHPVSPAGQLPADVSFTSVTLTRVQVPFGRNAHSHTHVQTRTRSDTHSTLSLIDITSKVRCPSAT